jgi:hypothetical protein
MGPVAATALPGPEELHHRLLDAGPPLSDRPIAPGSGHALDLWVLAIWVIKRYFRLE